ncbi:MAG: SDR family oxidoreductase [Gemmatimonadaceae bacterium]|nr:SDR family oxidoreductase [Gemmatimonadaceae bacterium]
MTSEFSGRVAFITGGASGLGRAAAHQLAAQGALVAIADVQLDAAESLVRELAAGGAQAIAVGCDVRDDRAVEIAVSTTVARFGRMDIAINAAGIGGPEVRTAEYAPDDWNRVIDVNLNGVWRCMRYEIPAMLAVGGGAIVNVASVAGLIGFPRHPAYAASKHGVVGLTKTAALEYGRKGLRINALCPGFTLTPMVQQMIDAGLPQEALASRVPLGRLGTADEVAAAALFLCSAAGAFMSGHALAIDGGIVAG